MSENNAVKLPEVIVFAGPNGSGKTTITGMAKTVGEYINADDIKRTTLCTDIEAAQKAEELRDEPRGRGSWFISRTIVSQNDPLTPSPWSINGSEIRVQIQSYNSFSVYVPDSYDSKK